MNASPGPLASLIPWCQGDFACLPMSYSKSNHIKVCTKVCANANCWKYKMRSQTSTVSPLVCAMNPRMEKTTRPENNDVTWSSKLMSPLLTSWRMKHWGYDGIEEYWGGGMKMTKFNHKSYNRGELSTENLSQGWLITSYRVGEGNEDCILVAIALKPAQHKSIQLVKEIMIDLMWGSDWSTCCRRRGWLHSRKLAQGRRSPIGEFFQFVGCSSSTYYTLRPRQQLSWWLGRVSD